MKLEKYFGLTRRLIGSTIAVASTMRADFSAQAQSIEPDVNVCEIAPAPRPLRYCAPLAPQSICDPAHGDGSAEQPGRAAAAAHCDD